MLRVFALALLALVVSLVARSRPAWAESPGNKATPVQVLSIWTNDADDQADALTQALRSRVRQVPGWSLTDSNQSFETLSIALRCPPTPNQLCLDRIGEQLHADHYIWGTISKAKGELTAELHLWTRGKPQVVATESYSENLKDPSDDALRAAAGRLIAKLTGSVTSGTLVVRAGAANGSVLVDGIAKGTLEGGLARLPVPGGAHNVAVRVGGFTAPPQQVTLLDGGEADLSFALSPVDGTPRGEPSPRPQEPTERKPFPMRKVVGYAAVVVGVGLLATAGIEGANWLSDKSASQDDRTRVPNTVADVCAVPANLSPAAASAASDACQKRDNASTAAALGWIFAGAGAVLAATGMVLVIGDHSGEAPIEPAAARAVRPKFEVIPALGARAAQVDLKVTF